jgi:hypothetical protein
MDRQRIAPFFVAWIREIKMQINGVPQASTLQKPQSKSAKTETSKAPRSYDSVSVKRGDHGIRTFERSTMSKLESLLEEAKKYLGVTDFNALDTSPEATAGRIADFALGMYGLYKQQNPDLDDEQSIQKFETLIRGAVNQGFSEARSILGSMGLMDDKVKEDADKTYDLVQERFDSFFAQAKESIAQEKDDKAAQEAEGVES